VARERRSMRKIKEVLRLKALGLTVRQIAESLGVGRSTVAEYLQRAEKAAVAWPVAENLDGDALEFPPPTVTRRPASGSRSTRAPPGWRWSRRAVTPASSIATVRERLAPYRSLIGSCQDRVVV
jgi:transcriptional regulator with XRE-family HTH domain